MFNKILVQTLTECASILLSCILGVIATSNTYMRTGKVLNGQLM